MGTGPMGVGGYSPHPTVRPAMRLFDFLERHDRHDLADPTRARNAALTMTDPVYSPNGQWLWTGSAWVPAPPATSPPPPGGSSADYFTPASHARSGASQATHAQASAEAGHPTTASFSTTQGRQSTAGPSREPGLLRRQLSRLDAQLEDSLHWKRLGVWRWVLAASCGLGLLAVLAALFDGGSATLGERMGGAAGGLLSWLIVGALVWVPGALYHRRTQSRSSQAPTPTPRWVIVGISLVVVGILAAIAVPSFITQRQKALDARATSGDLREMPECDPAAGVTVASAYGTCAASPISEAYRRRVAERCSVTLTAEWWQPAAGTVAFFHAYNDDADARIQPATGEVDCG